MFLLLRKSFVYLWLLLCITANAHAIPELKVTVLQSGTVNWELEHLKKQGYDEQNGFKLVINKVASLSAARLALTSNSTNMIVSDWLWAGKRIAAGDPLRFLPFSSQIGSIIVSPNQSLESLASLKGKNIGVAGGPLNKGWVLLQAAARDAGVDLRKEANIQFGAPPLQSQALKRGQIDILVTFWHYGARLETEGYQRWISLENLMLELGIESRVPMLGYIFKESLLKSEPELIAAFAKAITSTKADLATQDSAWAELKGLMKAENEEVYKALVAGYRNGNPEPLDDQQKEDAVKFFELIDNLGEYPSGYTLDKNLFYGDE
ncbi:MAG: ABC transporter substrate-binding protein [Neptuniibacter sp.]